MRNSKQKALFVTLALLLCAILLLTAFCEAYFRYPAYYYEDASVRQGLSGSLDTLVVGSSHAFRAFVPEILDESLGTSSYNLSCSMMTMQGRYELLQKEISRNPVKTVIFELSFNALTRNRAIEGPEGEIYLLGRLDNTAERISYFFRAIRPSEYAQVLHDTFDRSKTAWGLLLRGAIDVPQMQESRGFIPQPANDLSLGSYQEAFEMWYDDSFSDTYDAENEEYLDRCVRLCQDNHIRIVFVVTPMADEMLLHYSNIDAISQHEQALADQYGVEFYDFNLIRTRSDDYPSDSAFFDKLHLSGSGAETFSHSFAAVLQLVDQGQAVNDLFYDSYDQAGHALLDYIKNHQP